MFLLLLFLLLLLLAAVDFGFLMFVADGTLCWSFCLADTWQSSLILIGLLAIHKAITLLFSHASVINACCGQVQICKYRGVSSMHELHSSVYTDMMHAC